mgnify:CR=1 FL=1
MCYQGQASNATLVTILYPIRNDTTMIGRKPVYATNPARDSREVLEEREGNLGAILQRAWLHVNRRVYRDIGTKARNPLWQVLPQPAPWAPAGSLIGSNS